MKPSRLLPALLLLAGGAAHAFELRTLETRYDEHRYHVRLAALLDAAPPAIEKVLTDYARYPQLDPRIRWGRVIAQRPEGGVLLETMFHACVGIFCRDVRRVEEVAHRDGELTAIVIPGESDMRQGRANTRWRTEGAGSLLEYEAEFELKFWVPAFVARKLALRTMSEATVELFMNVERAAREH